MHKLINGQVVRLTEEEILTRKAEEKAEETKKAIYIHKDKYKDDRKLKYPTTDELIVALWEKFMGGDDSNALELEALRQGVKLKYPKPE